MKKIKNLLSALLLLATVGLQAQVGIGIASPAASAQLDVSSTTKGFLPPRMTYAERNAIQGPVAGLIVWCTDCGSTGELNVYNGTAWINMVGNPAVPPPVSPTVTSTSITEITGTTAVSGGNITADGYAAITARGVCWNTATNPTVALNTKTNDGTGSGSFVSSITGLTLGVTYYVRAYATNAIGTSYGDEFSFTTTALAVGQAFQGGIVAYILQPGDPGYIAGQTQGFVAASSDQGLWEFGCYGQLMGTQWGLGSGYQNTINIMNCGSLGTAARVCSDLILNGYSDWYLPSRDELDKLYLNRVAIGGFVPNYYWSSSEASNQSGVVQNFNDGSQPLFAKHAHTYVRAIRSFMVTAPASVLTAPISNITATSAVSGGNVTSEGNAAVTARGVCWDVATNPTVALSTKTADGAGTGSFVSNITGLTLGITYYVRAYATNANGTSYGNEISFSTVSLAVGESYQGGIIAYILQPGDPGFIAGETHGLIAAASDQSALPWGCSGTPIQGAEGIALGTGHQNTIEIMAGCAGAIAARQCGDLVLNGYSDWYLPSKEELNKLYINRAAIGGFASSNYWSSSEYDNGYSWNQYFGNGSQTVNMKTNLFFARAVRAF